MPPLYDYECHKCGDGAEIIHAMKDNPRVPCPSCGAKMGRVILQAPNIRPDLDDFSHERDRKTGLHGRYIPQLAKYPGDKRAVFKHVNDAKDAAKRRGLNVE